ncbi:Vegetative incompatibility protein HET-E-1 [Ceratobasidium sp. AG-Ba]|nr:Vegetative incompatibility protein HET-E-1 [Ceratobasidium sp. AG-Ba]
MFRKRERGPSIDDGPLRCPLPSRRPRVTANAEPWPGLVSLQRVLDEAVGPLEPLKSAISKLGWCLRNGTTINNEYKRIQDTLDGLLEDLSDHFRKSPPSMTPVIETLAQGIKKEAARLADRQYKKGLSRLLNASDGLDEIQTYYHRIADMLKRLQLNVNMSTWRAINEYSMESRLKSLPYVASAKYNSAQSGNLRRTACTPHTRVDLLRSLWDWANDPNSEKVFWLNGMAGTGKTTIAYSLCQRLRSEKMLAASFFCSQRLAECKSVSDIVPTISYQLAQFSRPFGHALSQAIEKNPDAPNQLPFDQFMDLLVEPLTKVRASMPTNLVVVIDALDECQDREAIGQIIDTLLLNACHISLKFFVASRPDTKILDQMRSSPGEQTPTELRLHELESSVVQSDIRTYLQSKLMTRLDLPADEFEVLVERCGVLFIFAATIARYIASDNFSRGLERFRQVLAITDGSAHHSGRDMDALYAAILTMAFDNLSMADSERTEMKAILYTIMTAQEPLSANVISGLLGLNDEACVHAAVRPLFSVLNVSDTSGEIMTLHKSFSDYLFNSDRSGSFYCDRDAHHAYLARACLECINKHCPSFNICGLSSSYIADKEVVGIDAIIKERISDALSYACRYWADHLANSIPSHALLPLVWEFLSGRLLLWMEVMSLKQVTKLSSGILDKCHQWLQRIPGAQGIHETLRLSSDASDFARSTWPNVQHCTPHIYVSALSFWPRDRPISQHYRQREPYIISDSSFCTEPSGPNPNHTSNRFAENVASITFSADGIYLASGSQEGTIRIWHLHNGQLAVGPFTAHKGTVSSLAFSPDGVYIASGSWDRTICRWETRTGQMVGEPFYGDTAGGIRCIAYSPSGNQLASGGWTIRFWDAKSSLLKAQTYDYRGAVIDSIAYSQDGSYLASCSRDGSLYIWGTCGAQLIASSPCSSKVDIWDISIDRVLKDLQIFNRRTDYSIDCSSAGTLVVSHYSKKLAIIKNACHKHSLYINMHDTSSQISPLAFSMDGAQFAFANKYFIWLCNSHFARDPLSTPLDHEYEFQSTACHQGKTSSTETLKGTCEGANGLLNSGRTALRSPHSTKIQLSENPTCTAAMGNDDAYHSPHICSSFCTLPGPHRPWGLREDGWIVTEDEKLLLWVPDALRARLPCPATIKLIPSEHESLYLEFDDAHIGEHWAEHFKPLTGTRSGQEHRSTPLDSPNEGPDFGDESDDLIQVELAITLSATNDRRQYHWRVPKLLGSSVITV